MKKQHWGMAFVVGAAAGTMAGVSCSEQPAPACLSAGYYTLNYDVKSNPNNCPVESGEAMGIEIYSAAPNATSYRFAFRPANVGSLLNGEYDADGNEVHAPQSDVNGPAKVNGLGRFPTNPKGGICEASDFEASEQNLQAGIFAGGAPDPDRPAVSFKYNFSELKVISSARLPGNLFKGVLEKTVDGCAITYDVTGFAPYVECEVKEECAPFASTDGGLPKGKTGIPEGMALDKSGNLAMICKGAEFDGGVNVTKGFCFPDFAARPFETIANDVK